MKDKDERLRAGFYGGTSLKMQKAPILKYEKNSHLTETSGGASLRSVASIKSGTAPEKSRTITTQRYHSRKPWRCLMVIWLLLVAGLPIYYLRADCDWYYREWGEPQEILESHQISENPLYRDENVYTRVFVVRPSAENLAYFRNLEYEGSCIYAESVDPLLKEYGLPEPYRFAHTGCVNFALCGNGLMLVHDFSRNKGGLFSSRLSQPDAVGHRYPMRFVFFYVWAMLSCFVLTLTPVLLILSPLLFLLGKVFSKVLKTGSRSADGKM